MSDTNETITDIIAEMRVQAGDDGYPLDIKHFADRLEAAHRREIAALGNAAAMREVLRASNRWIARLLEGGNDVSDVNMILAKLKNCMDANKAALAAPARNCDRPECRDIRAAMTVYRRECCGDGPLYPRKEGAMCEAGWLLAPAEEREGSTK